MHNIYFIIYNLYLVTLLDFPMAFSFFLGIGVNYSQCFFTSYFFKVKLK